MFKRLLKLNMSVKAVIGIMSAIIIAVGGMGLLGTSTTNDSFRNVYDNRTVPLGDLGVILDDIQNTRLDATMAAYSRNGEVVKQRKASIDENDAEINKRWKTYNETFLTPEEKLLVDAFNAGFKQFKDSRDRTMSLALAGDFDAAMANDLSESVSKFEAVHTTMYALFDLQATEGQKEFSTAQHTNAVFFTASMILILMGLAVIGYIGYSMAQQRKRDNDYQGQINAVSKAQAVIEFGLDGTIITANENFCKTLGYTLDEIKGKHHSMFAESAFAASPEYRYFWEKLNRGEFDAGQYKRVGKGGKEIWIQASYNPIMDMNGKPFKVVKYATDITEQVKAAAMLKQAVDETLGVVSLAKDGDLSKRIGMEGKSGEIGQLCSGVNALIDSCSASIDMQAKASAVLKEAVDQTLEVVSLAKEGDLTQRVPMEGKSGEIGQLCSGVNTLMDNCSASLGDVGEVLEALANGDLTKKITNEYHGIFGELKDNANATVEKLVEIISSIRAGTDAIDTSSKEISSGNNDLSQRTEEQASSLEETASSMEELTSTVKQNADNAKQANQLAIGASDIAVKGGKVVGEVVTTMSSINDSSKKIVDIISVIDGIAFQTNILALNAAVEAARAGEQGRGFAVVATEVRTLAQRSAAAAKEIKELISDSVSKVEIGTQLVDQAGKTMDEIVMSVKRVTDIMAEISAASQEQSSGIEQVNQAVTQMDEVTQQNAALVEEAAAASESMQEQADGLMRSVAIFKLRQEPSASNSVTAQAERRGANRAVNVERLPGSASTGKSGMKKTATPKVSAKTGTDSEWEEF